MNENKKLLSVKDLVVEYLSDGEIVHAVNGVSFDLEYGRTIALVGETGAGKTTIAKAICRILPQPGGTVKSGSIEFDGIDVLNATEDVMRSLRGSRLAMIFQDPMTALNPTMRIGDQIAEGIRFSQGASKADARAKAVEMLELVGIPEQRFREYPHQFSGGMKQRVVIAIALSCSPDLMIADEPTTALDVTIQAQVLELIRELQKKKNMALIMITHDFGIVAETCEELAVVYAGQIVEYGTTKQIFNKPMHPYTQGLFKAIPKVGAVAERLVPVKGSPTDPTRLPKGCYFAARCPYVSAACRQTPIAMHIEEDGHQCRCIQYSGKKEE